MGVCGQYLNARPISVGTAITAMIKKVAPVVVPL
jgi:hypothetical protein